MKIVLKKLRWIIQVNQAPTVTTEPAQPEPALLASVTARTLSPTLARLERAAEDHARRFYAGPGSHARSRARGGGRGPVLASGAGSGASLPSSLRLSRGEPLPDSPRARLESHFGRDFGDVRIHTDRAAADASKSLGARAFTLGTHIYFGAGQFDPGSSGGLAILGHEAAHVDQFHRGLTSLGVHKRGLGDVGLGSDRLERFAEDHERRLRQRNATRATMIESVSFEGDAAANPSSERIASRAVELAAEMLEHEPSSGVVDELVVRSRVVDPGDADGSARRIARAIVSAARAKAHGGSPSFSPVLSRARFLVDSGLFADREIPQDPKHAIAHGVLADPDPKNPLHSLLISKVVQSEVTGPKDKFGKQAPRLTGADPTTHGAERVVVDPIEEAEAEKDAKDLVTKALPEKILSEKFSLNDLTLLFLAKRLKVTFVTANEALTRQVDKRPLVKSAVGDVPVLFIPKREEIEGKIVDQLAKRAETLTKVAKKKEKEARNASANANYAAAATLFEETALLHANAANEIRAAIREAQLKDPGQLARAEKIAEGFDSASTAWSSRAANERARVPAKP
jgi:hypothetical protein